MNSPDFIKNKAQNWKANHFGTYLQNGSSKDATANAFIELTNRLSTGKFRDLHCTLSIDRNKRILSIKRLLDDVLLDEFSLMDISNISGFPVAPQNKSLVNLVTFATQTRDNKSQITETHIFQFDDINIVNYFVSDIRSAKEASMLFRSNSSPTKSLSPTAQKNSSKFDEIEFNQKIEEITSKTERKLLLLNYCFDDIELFIQHLNDQDEARALLSSRKNRPSDRLLEGKAKPPTLLAYIACIQKIKFCFNLLSKLDGKIKDPDSHELCRVLMDHLIKIGRSFSTYHNRKLSKVKEPLLTQMTTKLLQDSLPKEQFRIWTTWGDFWIKSRERWQGYEEKYCPEFFNGYQLDIEDLVNDGMLSPSIERRKTPTNNSPFKDVIVSMQSLSPASPSTNNNHYNDGKVLDKREEDFCRSVMLKKGRLYKVTSTFAASNDQELSLSAGEIIEVLESKNAKNWWMCENMQGQQGFSPNTLLEPFSYTDPALNSSKMVPQTAPASPTQNANYRPMSNSFLSKSHPIYPTSPKNNLTLEKSLEEAKKIREEIDSNINSVKSFGNPLARASFARPIAVQSKNHGQKYITQDSTTEDVKNWLRFKKFSDEDIERLKDFTGQALFMLSRDQMNRIVGVDVGQRLDSFVKVQKSCSGFGTLTSKELDEILTIRKNQVEFDESF